MEKTNPSKVAVLRQKAEELVKHILPEPRSHSPVEEVFELFHELQVYQVELELQNEELIAARSASQAAAEKYRELYDFAPSGYFTLSPDGEILELNLSGANMLGKERQSLVNARFGFFVTAETKPVFNNFLALIFGDCRKETCEVALTFDKSVRMYVQLNGALSEEGSHCLVNAVDITMRKMLEKNLINSKALLNETQKIGKIGGWVLDLKTFTHTWTEETFHILEMDITAGDTDSASGMGFIAPEFRSVAEVAMQRAIEYGEPYDQEWGIITAKGNKRWVHAVAKTSQEHGKTISISGAFQDITDRKLAEIALTARSTELEKINSFFVGREMKMIELKKEINELLTQSGLDEKYIIPT